jgi:hypothetical protein
MDEWKKGLKHDPLMPLLAAGNPAISFFVRRDFLGKMAEARDSLWKLAAAQKILRKQLPDGSWPRPGTHRHPAINDGLIETWRWLRYLVEQYGMTREHPQTGQAAEYIFSCQTADGDIRGILANQYATYYTGAIMALLIQAGYGDDARIERGFQWLLAMRQDDMGWSIPLITHKLDRKTQYRLTSEFCEPLEPDRTKPFSHNATGMILRAFAVHEHYCKSEAAVTAARLLKSRFFQPDAYASYQAASYWVRFEYPFWWNQLAAALDSLGRIGISKDDPQVQNALAWLAEHQQADGLWKVSYAREGEAERESAKADEMKLWISLAICRVFKRFFDQTG